VHEERTPQPNKALQPTSLRSALNLFVRPPPEALFMKRVAVLDSSTALRAKRLGDVGEALAEALLNLHGFANIRNLNHDRRNFPFADFFAERASTRYVISVKSRNRFEFSSPGPPRLNRRYKLGSQSPRHAADAAAHFNAFPAWLAIALDTHSYCAYFGLLSDLNGSLGINMSAAALLSYECLAREQPHTFQHASLLNVYEVRR
jgi:hypothetical protein